MKFPTDAFNVLERPASFSMEPFHISFDLGMPSFAVEEVAKLEENRRLWNLSVNHDVESLDKECRDVGTEGYSFTKELLFEYEKEDSGRWWSAK